MGTDVVAFPEDESDSNDHVAGGGGGSDVGGPPTLGGADDEPDRFVRLLLRVRDALKPGKSNVAPYVNFGQADSRARDRAEAISAWRYVGLGRFLEAPPDLDKTWIPGPDPDAKTEYALLRWQEQSAALLLLARAGDAVMTLVAEHAQSRGGFGETVDRTQPVVSMSPVPTWLTRLRPQLFPWRVEVRTTDPDFFAERLPRYAGWLGVGVDVVRGGDVKPFGHCRVDGGMDGTVAGLVGNEHGHRLQLTCAHVLAEHCTCARWRANLPPGVLSDEPDAAVLDGTSSCFSPRTNDAVSVPCATQDQLLELALGRTGVRRVGGRAFGTAGTVVGVSERGRVSTPATYVYAIGAGRMSRFPALSIVPRRSPLTRLLGPFGRRPFSKNGDSGSWVFDPEHHRWVGMVVAGDTDSGYSVAVNALELTRHVARNTGPLADEGHTWLT
jgi:hypothetical protein